MTIQIVILTWNNAQDFGPCMKSIVENTKADYKIMIVDNSSANGEHKKIIAALPDRCLSEFLQNQKNRGIPAAQNQALALVQNSYHGDAVILLDADTTVQPGWLTKITAYAQAHPEVGIIGGAKSPYGPPLPVYHHPNGRWYVYGDQTLDQECEGESIDFSCAYLRPELIERGLRFDERYKIYDGHDQDLCFRVRSWGYKIHQIDAGVLHYGSQIMKRSGYQWEGGGRTEWDLLRQKNVKLFSETWSEFLAPHRGSFRAERGHLERMNKRLVAEAGDRKAVPRCNTERI